MSKPPFASPEDQRAFALKRLRKHFDYVLNEARLMARIMRENEPEGAEERRIAATADLVVQLAEEYATAIERDALKLKELPVFSQKNPLMEDIPWPKEKEPKT